MSSPASGLQPPLLGPRKQTFYETKPKPCARSRGLDEGQMSIVESLSDKPDGAVALVVGPIEVFIPLEGMVDLAQERERLEAELKEAESHIARLEKMLNSPFAKKAPPAVVDKEREKLAGYKETAEKIKAQL